MGELIQFPQLDNCTYLNQSTPRRMDGPKYYAQTFPLLQRPPLILQLVDYDIDLDLYHFKGVEENVLVVKTAAEMQSVFFRPINYTEA